MHTQIGSEKNRKTKRASYLLQFVLSKSFSLCRLFEELIKSLVKRADIICGKLIAKMFRNHQKESTMYGSTGVAMFAF